MSNPLAKASYEARSARLRMAWTELLRLKKEYKKNLEKPVHK
jgi:hypothetical protein